MADFNQTRSDYLKIMMGGENSASSPYRPEQLNDLGGTSFDAASLSDADIDNAIKTLSQAGQEGTAVFNALNTEKEKREKDQEGKSWWDYVVDFLVNAGTSITEGIFKAVDEVKDFAIGVGAGLFGGGWFGAKNDFTDWAADVMKDDRWIDYATRAVDMVQANILRKEFWTGEGGYWSDWSYENTKRLQERHYEGLGWERTAGSFVGEMVPNLILAYFTGGSSLGVQAAAQGGLGFARGMGEAQSRALSEGASFQQSAGYGAVKGTIRGAMSAALTYAGGTFASRSANSVISKVGSKVGDAVLKKTGSVGLSAFANNATKFVIRVAGDAGEAAVFTAIEPALQQIYNDNAWYNAYGTEENRRSYAEQIGKSALIAAAFSAVTNALRDTIDIHRAGGRKAYLEKYASESYQRITENEVLKSLSPADRELAKQGADEWAKIEKEMQDIQNEYDTMKAKGIPESELEMYVHRSKEGLSERIEAYSGKYGGLFNKMAAKTHPDYLGTTDNARLSEARTSVFQKFASMTNKGLKEQLSSLINGDNGITALLSYTKGSEPIETVKENGNLVAKPQNVEQVQSVLAAASQDKGNVPSIIELPLKGGMSAQINIDGLQASQLEKLANLTVSDFKKQEDGSSVADLGDGKSLAVLTNGNSAEVKVIETEAVQPTAQEEKPLTLKAEPHIVKEAANAKEGKVYSLSSAKEMANAVETAVKSIFADGTITSEKAVPTASQETKIPTVRHISTLSEKKFAELLGRMSINELDDKELGHLDSVFEGDTGLTLEILDYNRHDLEPEIVRARAGKPLSRYDSSLADYQGEYPLTSKVLFGITYDKSDIANYDDPESQAYFDYKAMQDRIAPVLVEEFENMTSALDDAIEPLSDDDFSRVYSAYRYANSDAWQGFLDDAESAYNEKFYNMDEWFDEVRTAMDYFSDAFDNYVERMLESARQPVEPAEPQAVTSAIENAKLDKYSKGEMVKALFDNLNLGSEEQQAAAKEAFRKKLLDTEVKYDIKEGEETKTYTYKLSELLNELDGDKAKEFDDEFNKAWSELVASGDESRLTKVINDFTGKLEKVLAYAKDLKESVRIFGHLEKHRGNILRRYYHDNGETFGPSFDFDTQGYKVLLEPLHQLKPTNGKNSYTGKSAIAAFNQFLENYKAENFASHPTDNDEIVVYSSIYNQGLRDLASALVESIQDNSYIDKNGKTIYSSLDTKQLAMLRLFQDEVEKMPKRAETEAIEARKMAESAYQGVSRYVSSFLKNGKIGKVRGFLQKTMEIYGNQLDALRYEAGDNELSKAFYDDLYLASSQAIGMVDDYRSKIDDIRKTEGVTNKKLNSLSNFTDTNGEKVEMRYLVRIYHNLIAGEESNNVKYLNANTIYLTNSANKIVHICKFSSADKEKITNALYDAHLLNYAQELHLIESDDLRKVYDADYVRDYHIPNSNSISDYVRTILASNGSRLGKAYIQHGVANYGSRQDRVKEIPTGVHLVIKDAEESIMESVRNQANIHFNDPVLKKINLIYGTKLNKIGTTVKEYVIENNPHILELSTKCIFGAYGTNPNKQGKLINFVGNGYVMSLIGLNPSTILKQPLSIMWSNDISLGTVLKFTLAANLNKTIWQNSTRLKKEIEEEFPEYRIRGKQNEAIMGNVAADAVGKVQRAISKIAGFGIKKADAWTVGHEAIGLLAIQGQQLGYGEIGTPENDAYVKTHYRAFYATQVSSNRITMSGARAGYYGSIGKFTAFMTGAVQGQMGHIARALQQVIEFKGKTQQYYDDLIEKAKAGETEAKQAYEDAKAKLDETIKDFAEGNAEKEDVKSAKEDAKSKFEEYARAAGEKADAEHSAKAFRHFNDMGGTKGVVIQRLAGALITGLMLVGISELTSRLKGQKRWDEFDAGSAGTELAINTLGGWLPVVRDVVNAVKGYDMEIPEYVIVRQVYDLFSAIGEAVRDPSEKNGRAIIGQAIKSISAFLGIPATNLWKYVNGIIKTFSPSTAIQMNNLLYGASAVSLAKNAKEYAERNDISTASDLYQSLYAIAKTGEISREVAVEQTKLIAEGFNPTAKNIPSYVQDEEGARVDLTEKERDDFLKFYSKANEQVERLIKNAKYKSYQPETKAKEIKKVYDLYYEAARYRALGIDPQSKLGRLLAYASDYDDDIIALLVLIQQNSELADNARFTKKEQALKLVNKQAMSKKQKMLVLYLMGYGLSDENRKLVRNYLESLGFSKKQAEEFLPDKAVAEK